MQFPQEASTHFSDVSMCIQRLDIVFNDDEAIKLGSDGDHGLCPDNLKNCSHKKAEVVMTMSKRKISFSSFMPLFNSQRNQDTRYRADI